jgi:formate dehydrogenase subunit gamma
VNAPAKSIVRFDRTERAVHWTNATLFFILILTGASLKIGSFATLVANRHAVKTIHVYVGLLLPVPILVAIFLRAGKQFRTDLARMNRWSQDDKRWWSRRKRSGVQLGKFNPGQKLNTVFIGAVIVVMLMTGSIMRWFEPFPDSWRTGATFVHDSTWLVLLFVIAGHIVIALRDPDSMRSMLRGWVPESWARRERPQWWAEVVSGDAVRGPVGDVETGAQEGLLETRTGTSQVAVGDIEDGGAPNRVGHREL